MRYADLGFHTRLLIFKYVITVSDIRPEVSHFRDIAHLPSYRSLPSKATSVFPRNSAAPESIRARTMLYNFICKRPGSVCFKTSPL